MSTLAEAKAELARLKSRENVKSTTFVDGSKVEYFDMADRIAKLERDIAAAESGPGIIKLVSTTPK